MPERKADVLVLGAGMVGVCAALHLQRRGRTVILIDRHDQAGEETSFGNAGLIENASVFPYMFPRDFLQIIRYALNLAPQARYRFSDLPAFLPWLVRYFLASSPERALRSAMAELPLIRQSLAEHEALVAEAGVPQLLRQPGWLKLFRSDATMKAAASELEQARRFGVAGELLDGNGIRGLEPDLTGDFAGAIYWPEPGFVPDPGGLAKAYAALFVRKGGSFLVGDARTLEGCPGGWRVALSGGGAAIGREAVVALGPWSDQVFPSARIFHPVGDQAWLPSASGAARRCSSPSPGSRFRSRLSPGADEPGHSPDHGRGVRAPRCAASADPGRASVATRPRAVSVGRSTGRQALDGCAPMSAGYAARDRKGATPPRALVRFRASASRSDARSGHRPAAGGDDDR